MVRLLTVKYDKEEERVLLTSNVLGVLVGIPTGVLIGYLIGLFNNLKVATASSTGWTMLWLQTGLIIVPICWMATLATSLYLNNKENPSDSMQTRKMVPGTLIFPLTIGYGFLVTGLVIFPLVDLLTPYITATIAMLVGLVVLFPFVIMMIALILPETPAGKSLRRRAHRVAHRDG
jgi:hypothetical protein